MDEEAMEFLKQCIQIYSPSRNEDKLAKYLADFLKNHGFNVQFDKIGNLIAEKGEGKPVLLLVSHMDTIPGEIPFKVEEGKIYGRGAVDCKPSLAAMVYSVSKYDFNKENSGKIIFGGIVREEESLIGVQEFMQSNINPDYSIFGEPTKIDQISLGYKGRLCVGFRIVTKTGDVANSWQHINAIEVALQIWNIIKGLCWQFNEMYHSMEDKTKHYDQIIPNITMISGGHLSNCIPSEGIIQVDIRFPPVIHSTRILEEIRKSIIDFKNMYVNQTKLDFSVQINVSSQIEGFEIESDNLLVEALSWAIFKTINEKPRLIKKTGTPCIHLIGLKNNGPSIIFGPGEPKLEHTNEEFIEIDEYIKAIEIYLQFFDKLFESYHQKN